MNTMKWSILLLAVGLSMSACADEGPPTFLSATHLSNSTSDIGPYIIYADVVDDVEVTGVELRYKVDEDEWVLSDMEPQNDAVWIGRIPGQSFGSIVRYQLVARDEDGNEAAYPPLPESETEDQAASPAVLTFSVVEPGS